MTEFADIRTDCRGDRGEINRPCRPAVLAGLGFAGMVGSKAPVRGERAGRRVPDRDWGAWGDICRAVPAARPVPEMSLGDMLADPIVCDLMDADGVDPSALRASLKELASQLAQQRSVDPAG